MVLPEPGGPVRSRLWRAGGGDLERAPRPRLAAHVGQVGDRDRRQVRRRRRNRLGLVAVVQDVDHLAQAAGGDHGHRARQRRLGRALRGDRRAPRRPTLPAASAIARAPRTGRRAPSRPSSAAAATRATRSRGACPDAASTASAIARSNPRALLALLGGREVDRQPPHREVELGRGDAAAHALARLLHGAVGQADDDERRHAVGDVRLDVDPPGGDPRQPERERARDHGSSVGRGRVTGG